MHDIIADVLASPMVPANETRDEIYRQLDEFRSAAGHVMSMDEWRGMAEQVGRIRRANPIRPRATSTTIRNTRGGGCER